MAEFAAEGRGGPTDTDTMLGRELREYGAGEHYAEQGRTELDVHGSRVLLRRRSQLANLRAMQRERFDLLLTIDYNLGYSVYLRSLPRTPTIVWVRDARTPEDAEKILGVRIPGGPNEPPHGLMSHDGRSLARIARESSLFGRRLMLATPTPLLVTKLERAYGFEPWDFHLLPNPILLEPPVVRKSERLTVVLLARLDPIKRPWLFAELARSFPEVEFQFLGQPHFTGRNAWSLDDLPPNVRLVGHVDEAEKLRLLSAAWVAINTSVHESLAVSFLEALACSTPLLSCVNIGYTVSRYGIFTGRFDGSGMDSLDAFRAGLRTLLDNEALRTELASKGRDWVRTTHSLPNFLGAFDRLAARAGLAR